MREGRSTEESNKQNEDRWSSAFHTCLLLTRQILKDSSPKADEREFRFQGTGSLTAAEWSARREGCVMR